MKFKDIIGQEGVKEKLMDFIKTGKIPHAIMLSGKEGSGTMPLAIAFAQYLLCQGNQKKATPKKHETKAATLDLFGEPIKTEAAQLDLFGEPVKPDGPQLDLFGEPVKPSEPQQLDLFGEPVKPAEPQMDLFGEPVIQVNEGTESSDVEESDVSEAPVERPCGKCRSCSLAEKLQHPDLHFMFPIYNRKKGDNFCDDFIGEWREMLLSTPYFTYSDWMEACGADNQQLRIYGVESDTIFKKLSLVASQGGYKVCVIWLPEKMHEACANKMLKLLEEPPEKTVFIMVSEEPEQLLQTIQSRVQTIPVPPLTEDEIFESLTTTYHVQEGSARIIAHSCQGNISKALEMISGNNDTTMYFELFVSLMRLSYMKKVKEMKKWSEEVAGMGRERQKHFLDYCQRMVRENFIYNFHRPELNYMSEAESNFATKFAPFINEKNVIGIMEELAACDRDISQNANAKIVFFDFALKMIVLIKNR